MTLPQIAGPDKNSPISMTEARNWILEAKRLFDNWLSGRTSDAEAQTQMRAHEFITLCRPLEGEDIEVEENNSPEINRLREELESAAAPLANALQLFLKFQKCSMAIGGDDGQKIRKALLNAEANQGAQSLLIAALTTEFD